MSECRNSEKIMPDDAEIANFIASYLRKHKAVSDDGLVRGALSHFGIFRSPAPTESEILAMSYAFLGTAGPQNTRVIAFAEAVLAMWGRCDCFSIVEKNEYPALPEKTYLGDDVSYGHEDWAMQAYVDSDRAMRVEAGFIPEHATTRLLELSMVWAREADRLQMAGGMRNIGTADGLRTALADLQREIALLCAESLI